MFAGVAKAWHIHHRQVDWWYVPIGNVKAVLHDMRPDSPTQGVTLEVFLGDNYEPVVLPPGVAHGVKVLSGEAHLFYITSTVYNPEDEGRIPHDDPEIGYDWTALPPIT